MQPLERADKLRHEADEVLEIMGLFEILRPYGKVFPSGSYFLDVMVYPDIDMYITTVSLDQLFELAAKIARCELVTQVVFEKTDDPVHMPGGLYLKPRINYGDWGRPWKIDIWSLSEKVIQHKMADMHHFQSRLTPELREKIIRYKLSILTSQLRTPMYSGIYIYKAFIDEGLRDEASVTRYLKSSGIKVEE